MTSLRFSLTLSRYPLLCIWLNVLLLFRAPSPVLPVLACNVNCQHSRCLNEYRVLLACRENDLARSLAGSTSDTAWKSLSTWEASSSREVFRPSKDILPFRFTLGLATGDFCQPQPNPIPPSLLVRSSSEDQLLFCKGWTFQAFLSNTDGQQQWGRRW